MYESSCYSMSSAAFDSISFGFGQVMCVCFVVVLTWISLMTYVVEHSFICLLAISVSSLMTYLLRFLIHFLIDYCWLLRIPSIIWIIVLYQMYLLQIFYSKLCLIFSFFWHCHKVEVFNFTEVLFSAISSWMSLCCVLKLIAKPMVISVFFHIHLLQVL